MKSLQHIALRSSAAIAGLVTPALAWAAAATGGAFLGAIPTIGTATDIRVTTLQVIDSILKFMALIAVVFIVIAGIRLVISQGEESAKDNAKKTIVYVIIGLIVLVLASAFITFVIDAIS